MSVWLMQSCSESTACHQNPCTIESLAHNPSIYSSFSLTVNSSTPSAAQSPSSRTYSRFDVTAAAAAIRAWSGPAGLSASRSNPVLICRAAMMNSKLQRLKVRTLKMMMIKNTPFLYPGPRTACSCCSLLIFFPALYKYAYPS